MKVIASVAALLLVSVAPVAGHARWKVRWRYTNAMLSEMIACIMPGIHQCYLRLLHSLKSLWHVFHGDLYLAIRRYRAPFSFCSIFIFCIWTTVPPPSWRERCGWEAHTLFQHRKQGGTLWTRLWNVWVEHELINWIDSFWLTHLMHVNQSYIYMYACL